MGIWAIILPIETRENLVQLLGEHGIQCEIGPPDQFGRQRFMCSDAKSYVPLKCAECEVIGVRGKRLGKILTLRRENPPNRTWKNRHLDFRLLKRIEAILAPFQQKVNADFYEPEARDRSPASSSPELYDD